MSMLPAVLTYHTSRTICNSYCRTLNRLHTSAIFSFNTTKKPEIIAKTRINETTGAEESSEKHVFCSILTSDAHKILLQETQPNAILDILALYVLASDIQVHQKALDSNITLKSSCFVSMRRSKFEKITKFPIFSGIVIGSFTCLEDEIIKRNWETLVNTLDLTDKDPKEIFMNDLETTLPHSEASLTKPSANMRRITRTNLTKSVNLKRNIVGYYLCQGLPNVRLAIEVFHRAKMLLCASKGDFTPEEDKIIAEFVETEGAKWAKLAKLLGRTSYQPVKYRYALLQTKEQNKKRRYFTVDEVKMIMTEVFRLHENVLDDENLTMEQCQNIGKKLNRSGTTVYNHWKNEVEPMLKKYHAGSPEIDLKSVLIQHLLDKGMNYTQEVNWKELVKDTKFAGTTPALLRRTYQNLRSNTKKKYPELRPEELSTVAIQRYLDNRSKYNRKNTYKDLIDFYVENILHTKKL